MTGMGCSAAGRLIHLMEMTELADDVTVVPIFSGGAIGPTHIALPAGQGGIRKASVLFCEEIATIDRRFLARGPWGERVDAELLDVVVRGIRRSIGETVPEPS